MFRYSHDLDVFFLESCRSFWNTVAVDASVVTFRLTRMPAKRKAEDSAVIVDPSKKSRFSEWLSDSDEESESSEMPQNTKNDASGEESVSDDNDMDAKPYYLESNHITEQISFLKRSQKTESLHSLPLPLESPSDPKLETSSSNFMDLGVISSLVSSLNAMSIRKPTPVQAACIPPLLQGMSLP